MYAELELDLKDCLVANGLFSSEHLENTQGKMMGVIIWNCSVKQSSA